MAITTGNERRAAVEERKTLVKRMRSTLESGDKLKALPEMRKRLEALMDDIANYDREWLKKMAERATSNETALTGKVQEALEAAKKLLGEKKLSQETFDAMKKDLLPAGEITKESKAKIAKIRSQMDGLMKTFSVQAIKVVSARKDLDRTQNSTTWRQLFDAEGAITTTMTNVGVIQENAQKALQKAQVSVDTVLENAAPVIGKSPAEMHIHGTSDDDDEDDDNEFHGLRKDRNQSAEVVKKTALSFYRRGQLAYAKHINDFIPNDEDVEHDLKLVAQRFLDIHASLMQAFKVERNPMSKQSLIAFAAFMGLPGYSFTAAMKSNDNVKVALRLDDEDMREGPKPQVKSPGLRDRLKSMIPSKKPDDGKAMGRAKAEAQAFIKEWKTIQPGYFELFDAVHLQGKIGRAVTSALAEYEKAMQELAKVASKHGNEYPFFEIAIDTVSRVGHAQSLALKKAIK